MFFIKQNEYAFYDNDSHFWFEIGLRLSQFQGIVYSNTNINKMSHGNHFEVFSFNITNLLIKKSDFQENSNFDSLKLITMHTIINFTGKHKIALLRISKAILPGLLFLISVSCQKSEVDVQDQESFELKNGFISSDYQPCPGQNSDIIYGPTIFTRFSGAPYVKTELIKIRNFNCYNGNFILKIQNGRDKRTRVSSADIMINDVLIAGPSDFSKNVSLLTFPLSGLTPTSILKVKINSSPGSFIKIWITGTRIINTPAFEQIGPLKVGSVAPVLPTVSVNGISGKWSPEYISTAEAGIFTFTFTPAEGQCSGISTMKIEIVAEEKVTDPEGYSYKTVKIGEQWWFAENLRTAKYNNGDLIGTTTPSTSDITGEAAPKYQWVYDGDENNVSIYGRLYTWNVVSDSRGVCPTGWHVATSEDWQALFSFVGGRLYAAGKLKEAGTVNWRSPNTGATNEIGFSALPGGFRTETDSRFYDINTAGSWWASNLGIVHMFYNDAQAFFATAGPHMGQSIRCVRD
jgi:uncharacterized protein (TIGR02145 family)